MLRWLRGGSGPAVARSFHALLALCALAAWISLGVQILVLIGEQGLLPVTPMLESIAATDGFRWYRFPTFLLLGSSDAVLLAGIVVGVVLAALALLGVWPRLCLGLSAPLYLGYVLGARTFLSFQWDNLLVEALLLSAFLPRDRAAPVAHWVMRALLFKLYFLSGIAKAQSYLGDWWDGSAMTFYYETAPLPAWPAWWAHHLPETWHHLESWGALGLETLGALMILGPRPARLVAFFAFGAFQLMNLATANYGFFVYLALALHVFLLDDADVQRLARLLRRVPHPRLPQLPRLPSLRAPAVLAPWLRAGGVLLAAAWLLLSLNTAIANFGPEGEWTDAAVQRLGTYRVYRIANAYYLFGHVTRERVEAEFQVLEGDEWTALPLRYKPGDPAVAPGFVAPHQPRVDFRLWFYGLNFRTSTPNYVTMLVERICVQPDAVAGLFATPLPDEPVGARIAYWQYHFTTPEERDETGNWWRRKQHGVTSPVDCAERRTLAAARD